MATTYILRLVRANATHYDLLTHCPTVIPDPKYEYDDDSPPRLGSILQRWLIKGIMYGAGAVATETAWAALRAKIEDPTSAPDGIRLIRNETAGDTIIERMDPQASTAWADFRVNWMRPILSDGMWRSEVAYEMEVEARKNFALGSGIVNLEQQERWSYDARGLLTHSLTGVVRTAAGGAEAVARTLGLADPGGSYAFATKGPQGVDVEVLDSGGRQARFTSIVQEAGAQLPSNTAADYSEQVATASDGVEETTTTVVSAEGTGAATAARSARPATRLIVSDVRIDAPQRRASATYVTVRRASGQPVAVIHRTVSIRPGGNPLRYRPVSGAAPHRHLLAAEPAEVVEAVTVELLGINDPSAFVVPVPLAVAGLVEDRSRREVGAPQRTRHGIDHSGDRNVATLRRFYSAANADGLDALIGEALNHTPATVPLTGEVSRA